MKATTIVLFGATGDLAVTKLFPALAQIQTDLSIQIVAVGRRDYSREQYLEWLAGQVADARIIDSLRSIIFYFKLDFESPESYAILGTFISEIEDEQSARIYYLSVPPQLYLSIALGLSNCVKNNDGISRIVLEKPFGFDEESSAELDRELCKLFSEEELYRVDHYLAKETVQNIMAFRFANILFESIWNKNFIDHIQITVAESDGVADRINFYDQVGATRDMLQNHLLQLLTVLVMEEPNSLKASDLFQAKAAVLRQLKVVESSLVFGQYEGYQSELNSEASSNTETFVMAELELPTERWQGVPLYVRTGKNLSRKISEVSVVFKEKHGELFSLPESERSNVVTFRLQPDEGVAVELGVKQPGKRDPLAAVLLEFCYAATFSAPLPDAYEQLFRALIAGDRSWAISLEEIQASWVIADQVRGHITASPDVYEKGSWGPKAAEELLQSKGRRWLAHESKVCNRISIVSK